MTDEQWPDQDRRQGFDRREDHNWYNNKELFEQIQGIKDKVDNKIDTMQKGLDNQFQNLTHDVRKHNNFNDKIESIATGNLENNKEIKKITAQLNDQIVKCSNVQAIKKGKSDVKETWKDWWPIALSTILGLLIILERIGIIN